jgi:hypothetical protein
MQKLVRRQSGRAVLSRRGSRQRRRDFRTNGMIAALDFLDSVESDPRAREQMQKPVEEGLGRAMV